MTAASPVFFALGVIVGLLHFSALARAATRIVRTGGSAVAHHEARSIPTLFGFLTAAFHGWPAVLATMAGLLVGRAVLLRRLGPQA